MKQRKWTCDRCSGVALVADGHSPAGWKSVTVAGMGFDSSAKAMEFCDRCARDICRPLPMAAVEVTP